MPTHNVIRIQGTLPGGEVWSVNPRFVVTDRTAIEDYDALLAWAEAIRTHIVALPNTNALLANMSTAVAITSIRAEWITAAGTMGMAAEAVFNSPKTGAGLATKPYQTSLVSSLLTGRPGRSYRGRLYWPLLGVSVSSDTLRVNAAQLQGISDAVRNLLRFLQDGFDFEPGLVLAVVSQTRNAATPVTQISCGDVLDVQRRRRDAVAESRVSSVFPGTP